MLYGQVPDLERAGFSSSDEQKGDFVQSRWGEDAVPLIALATKRASWNKWNWGYGTWPAIPLHKWTGVTVEDTGQRIVELHLEECTLTGRFLFARCISMVHESPKH